MAIDSERETQQLEISFKILLVDNQLCLETRTERQETSKARYSKHKFL